MKNVTPYKHWITAIKRHDKIVMDYDSTEIPKVVEYCPDEVCPFPEWVIISEDKKRPITKRYAIYGTVQSVLYFGNKTNPTWKKLIG